MPLSMQVCDLFQEVAGERLEDAPTHTDLLTDTIPFEQLKQLQHTDAWLPQDAAADVEMTSGERVVPKLRLVACLCRHVAEEATAKRAAEGPAAILVRYCLACLCVCLILAVPLEVLTTLNWAERDWYARRRRGALHVPRLSRFS